MSSLSRFSSSDSPVPTRGGLYLVFEGIDGSGKSTQCRRLYDRLRAAHWDSVLTREPTDGTHGHRLRSLAEQGTRLPPEEELALFIEDRKQHLKTLVRPKLVQGCIVIQDRYYFSTMAYQGSRGLDPTQIFEEHQAFAPMPDLTFLFTLSPETALQRVQESRGDIPNAFEKHSSLAKCAAVFQDLNIPGLQRLDATKSPDALHDEIWSHVAPRLSK